MCLMGVIMCVVHVCGGQKSGSGVLLSHTETGSLAASEHRLRKVGQSVSLRSHWCWDYRCVPPLCAFSVGAGPPNSDPVLTQCALYCEAGSVSSL